MFCANAAKWATKSHLTCGVEMRRVFSGLVLVVVLFVITVLCTGIYYLQQHQESLTELEAEQIAAGNIHTLVFSSSLWSQYPSFPSVKFLIYVPALVSSGFLLTVFVYLLGFRNKKHLLSASLGCLFAAALHYLVGMWALAGNTVFDYAGRWLAVMLVGMLYCCIGCVVFAGADVLKITLNKIFK
jgi:hypothetical protein